MKNKITYKKSGVDIDKANDFVRSIKPFVTSTLDKAALQRKGSFGGLFALGKGYRDPVLVSSTDGVGTKLLVAQTLKKHDTVGIDLVAMNVNDILCVGAKPLFFLDYIACGKLTPKVLKNVVKGIAQGCRLSGCSLVGGETAEMPDMYGKDEYDLAGFAVGVVEKSKILDGSKIKKGDRLVGLPSSGLHSNGFSLVRKALGSAELKKFSKEILQPTKIYAREVELLLEKFRVKAIAHVTGGAFYEKITKVLPQGLCFSIEKKSWPQPEIFRVIQKKAGIDDKEMYKTFNMGIGLVVVVSRKDLPAVQIFLKKKRIKAYNIGEVIKGKQKVVFEEHFNQRGKKR